MSHIFYAFRVAGCDTRHYAVQQDVRGHTDAGQSFAEPARGSVSHARAELVRHVQHLALPAEGKVAATARRRPSHHSGGRGLSHGRRAAGVGGCSAMVKGSMLEHVYTLCAADGVPGAWHAIRGGHATAATDSAGAVARAQPSGGACPSSLLSNPVKQFLFLVCFSPAQHWHHPWQYVQAPRSIATLALNCRGCLRA